MTATKELYTLHKCEYIDKTFIACWSEDNSVFTGWVNTTGESSLISVPTIEAGAVIWNKFYTDFLEEFTQGSTNSEVS